MASSTLQTTIRGLSQNVVLYDREKIESILVDRKNINLIKRYFPNSYKKILNEKFSPSNILSEYSPLSCDFCGVDLLTHKKYNLGLIAFVLQSDTNLVIDIYWACKGTCDKTLDRKYPGYITSWEDISAIMIPSKYLSWICAILNRMRDGDDVYTVEAFEKLKKFLICLGQMVLKNQSEEDWKRMYTLMSLPMI